MKNTILNSLALLGLTTLVACQGTNPEFTFPAKAPAAKVDYQVAQQTQDGLVINYDRRVDILLVIDDSASMLAHQANLSRNINRFIEGFASKASDIDFHLAYTYVYDRHRYGPIVPDKCRANSVDLKGNRVDGRVNWELPGTLKPFVGPANLLPKDGRRYLTKDDHYETLMKLTLDPAGDINQVVLNLIVNAAHAIVDLAATGSANKGTITVSTRTERGCAIVEVSDTGTGIPVAIRHRVFDPFFTTKGVGRGTGQGLAISYNVVVIKHGGTIDFHTVIGSGTRFTVRLPLVAPDENNNATLTSSTAKEVLI